MMPVMSHDAGQKTILHICGRDSLRPLRDQILRIAGFQVDSTPDCDEGLSSFWSRHYDLVLLDVESEDEIPNAERLCSAIKTANPQQLVAFVCNWRVAVLTDCPDEILRTEFDPHRFLTGVKGLVA